MNVISGHVIRVRDRAANSGRVVQPGIPAPVFVPDIPRATVSVNQARVKQVFDGIIFYKVIKVVMQFAEDRLFVEGE